MSEAFGSIKRGLGGTIAHSRGRKSGVRDYRPHSVDVGSVRERLGMSQPQFAARFGVSVATLRHWERGDRTPQGPALVLLNLIERDPVGVMRRLAR